MFTDKILLWLWIAGIVAPVITHLLRRMLIKQSTFFRRDTVALLLAGVVTGVLSVSILAYFTTVTILGAILAFGLVFTVGHWVFKVLLQRWWSRIEGIG